MKVWIDQDLCTGDGLCTEIAPSVFMMRSDGLVAHVKEVTWPNLLGPDGLAPKPVLEKSEGMAFVPDDMIEVVVTAAEECPGECIFLEA